MDQHRKTEDVGPAVPRGAADPLRRGVRPAHRRRDAHPFERGCDAQAGEPRVFTGEQDVARMERPVRNADDRGEIEGAGELSGDPHRVGGRRGTVLPDGEV